MKKVLIFLIVLLIPCIAHSQTIFLDNGSGVNNGCSTYDPATRSCSGGSYRAYTSPWDASQALKSGDNLSIRQGEYYENITGKSGFSWNWGAIKINDAISNVTVTNYNGEEVWIKGGSSRTSVVNHTNNAMSFSGSNNKVIGVNYNLHFYGCVIFSGTSNLIQGCDLSGGWDHQSPIGGDAWYDVIRFIGSVDALLRDCKIHDNYNHGTTTAAANKALIMHEVDVNSIVENCEFFNPVTYYVYAKYQGASGTVHATYRYNFFKGPNGGISGPNHNAGKELKVYQNVFFGNPNLYSDCLESSKFIVYNNTMYNSTGFFSCWTGSAALISNNNIFFANNASIRVINLDGVAWAGGVLNHNNYYASGTGSFSWFTTATDNSLSTWRNRTSQDINSVTTNPGFVNLTGLFNSPSDFKRSSYPANGRGGSYPSVMGAYITGNEVIGLLQGQSSSLPAVSTLSVISVSPN